MLGATPNLEEDGKYFPLSGQASSVAELFERFLKKNGIDVLYGTKIKDIDLTNKKLKLIAKLFKEHKLKHIYVLFYFFNSF